MNMWYEIIEESENNKKELIKHLEKRGCKKNEDGDYILLVGEGYNDAVIKVNIGFSSVKMSITFEFEKWDNNKDYFNDIFYHLNNKYGMKISEGKRVDDNCVYSHYCRDFLYAIVVFELIKDKLI